MLIKLYSPKILFLVSTLDIEKRGYRPYRVEKEKGLLVRYGSATRNTEKGDRGSEAEHTHTHAVTHGN